QLSPYQAAKLQPILQRFRTASKIHADGGLLCEELRRAAAGRTAGARVILQTGGKGTMRLRYLSGDREAVQSETEFPADIQSPLPKNGCCYSYDFLLEAARLVSGQEADLLFDRAGTLMLRTEHELHVLMPMRMPQTAKAKQKNKAA